MKGWWNLERAKVDLEDYLDSNPTYPFKKLFPDDDDLLVYGYSRRIPYLKFGLFGVVASILCLFVYGLVGAEQVNIVILHPK